MERPLNIIVLHISDEGYWHKSDFKYQRLLHILYDNEQFVLKKLSSSRILHITSICVYEDYNLNKCESLNLSFCKLGRSTFWCSPQYNLSQT